MLLNNVFQNKVDIAFAMFNYKAKFKGSQGLLKLDDIDKLAENFITTKALHAFVHSGAIPKVYSKLFQFLARLGIFIPMPVTNLGQL